MSQCLSHSSPSGSAEDFPAADPATPEPLPAASQPPSDGATAFQPSAGDWFVLHTKSRQEKAVSDALRALNILHFLPLLPHIRQYGKRKITVELPLFPSYVFLRGSREHAYTADRTKHVARIITVADQARLDWELRNIHLALQHKVPLDPYPFLKKGIRAEVRSGPLRGLQGVIESRTHANRLILQVDMLGRALSVEVDGTLLDALD